MTAVPGSNSETPPTLEAPTAPVNADAPPKPAGAVPATGTPAAEPSAQPPGETPAADEKTDQPDSAQPEAEKSDDAETDEPAGQSAELAGPAVVSRFRGVKGTRGRSANGVGLPAWFRVFLVGLAVFVSGAGLFSLLMFPFTTESQRPPVFCAYVDQYASTAFPPNDFATADAARVMGLEAAAMEESTDCVVGMGPSDFRRFFRDRLSQSSASVGVAYLSAHAHTNGVSAWVIPADAKSTHESDGYSIGELLDAFAESGLQNLLVLIETGRNPRNLDLGITANAVPPAIESVFSQRADAWKNDPAMQDRGLVLVCSTSAGQTAWTSHALGGSPFSVAIAYGLAGGKACDGIESPELEDLFVSASELAAYTQQTTANWSLENRGALQLPVVLQFGDDFPIREVDPLVTVSQSLIGAVGSEAAESTAETPVAEVASPETVAPGAAPKEAGGPAAGAEDSAVAAKPETTSDAKAGPAAPAAGGKVAAAEAKTTGEGEATSAPAADRALAGREGSATANPEFDQPTAETVISQIQTLTQDHVTTLNRPHRESLFVHSLARAKSLLTTGQVVAADAVLARLATPDAENTRIPVVAGSPEGSGAVPQSGFDMLELLSPQIQSALASPVDATVETIRGQDDCLSELLVLLAERTRQDEQWIDPDTVRLAIETRAAACSIGTACSPELLDFHRAKIEKADELRRRAEVELLDRRFSNAVPLLSSSLALYRSIGRSLVTQQQALDAVESLAFRLPWYTDLVVGHPHQTVAIEMTASRFVANLAYFVERPTAAGLVSLSVEAAAVDEAVESVVVRSLSAVDVTLVRDAAGIPGLSRELQVSVRNRLMQLPDTLALQSGYSHPKEIQLPDVDTRLLNSLLVFAMQSQGKRDSSASSIAESINVIRESGATFVEDEWFANRFRTLVAARWTGSTPDHLEAFDTACERLTNQAESRRSGFQVARLRADCRTLPLSFSHEFNQLQTGSNNSVNRMRNPPPQFLYSGDPRVMLTHGQSATIPFTLTGSEHLSTHNNATLVVQSWPQEACDLSVGDITSQNGRLEYPLQDFVSGSVEPISLVVSTLSAEGVTPVQPRLSASLRTADGRIQWLPFSIESRTVEKPVAQLVVEWADQGQSRGIVDLLPNQTLPLKISVHKASTDVTGLRLEFIGDDVVQHPIPDTKTTIIPVVPAADFASACTEHGITLRLLSGDTLLDERSIAVSVLDPSQCFESEWAFNPSKRKVSASIRQTRRSDAAADSTVQIETLGKDAEWIPLPQSRQRTLTQDEPQSVLRGNIPFSARLPIDVAVRIDGVSRLARTEFSMQNLTGQAKTGVGVQIQGLQEGARISGVTVPGKSGAGGKGRFIIPVQLRADGPEQGTTVAIGIDQNNNRRLDEGEQLASQESWKGRTSRIELYAAGKPPQLRVRSVVQDPVFRVDLSGIDGPATIVASATANGQQVHDAVELFIVRNAPQLVIVWPTAGSQIPGDRPLRVTVRTDSPAFRAVEGVEFGFDKNRNGKFDPGEGVVPISKTGKLTRFVDDPKATVHLPVKGLKAGGFALMARSHVSVSSIAEPGKTQLVSSSAATQNLQLVTTGTVSGRVLLADGTPVASAAVGIPGRAPTYTNASGEYSFQNVPPGAISVTAKSTSRQGVSTATVRPVQVTRADITIVIN